MTEFQAWAGDCYRVGCFLEIGVWDGSETPEASPRKVRVLPWRLLPSEAPLPSATSGYFRCSAGEILFQVGIAVALAEEDDAARRISVGRRCSEPGGLYPYIDDAYVRPTHPVGRAGRRL
ncbi:hypothetical protein ACTVZO_38190 [Streptomyces sp. IBSNAI002]|uniref:hypothetical protein n=1 Tax=Streptomyces sp. IBSNAI002 TaxID=3457500 RepID=UPI003FD67D4A